MNKIYVILILIMCSISIIALPSDTCDDTIFSFTNPTKESREQADSIMKYVVENAFLYAHAITKYKAEIYIKGETEIVKQNSLIRFAHHLFPVDRKKKNVIFEMISESEYDAPNLYKHNLKAINGNTIPNRKKQEEVVTFLNINVYAPTIYDESIITPVGRKATHYYEFNVEEIEEAEEKLIYKIRFTPKQWSPKLANGYLYVCSDEWRIEKIDMSGRFDFADFNIIMTFGHSYGQLILPNKADLTLRYNMLGNTVLSTYHSSFDYKNMEWRESLNKPYEKKRQNKSLDLTQYYTVTTDSVPFIRDSSYWNEKRDIPLTAKEKEVYQIHYPSQRNEDKDTTEVIDYMELTERLTSNLYYDSNSRSTRIRYSGILNPLQLGYSSRNGITYKQQLRITKTFHDERQLIIRPEVGYLFKRKELFVKLQNEWHYLPEKKGSLQLLLANDNQTYSSQMMQDINEHLKDSLFDFKDLNLDYYRHYYIDLRNNIELSNGFQFSTSLSYHRREPVIKKKPEVDPSGEIEEIIDETYYDFIPAIRFTYTPRQYYWMNGRKKEYVYSHYPTMSIEFARGIPDVLKSSGNYGRLEVDIHQSLNIGILRHFNYHLSGGFYTRKKSIYFAEFNYFTRRNFPESWDDRIGGVFHTLGREWFNASDKYIQGHFMYESPFILMQLFNKKASRHVLSERLYLGQVWTPALNWYTEIGYGMGNAIFNVAVFAGFKKHEYQNLGFRFTFEIE